MTKRELIELLEQVPDDEEVYGQHPDSGWPYAPVLTVEVVDGKWTVCCA